MSDSAMRAKWGGGLGTERLRERGTHVLHGKAYTI